MMQCEDCGRVATWLFFERCCQGLMVECGCQGIPLQNWLCSIHAKKTANQYKKELAGGSAWFEKIEKEPND